MEIKNFRLLQRRIEQIEQRDACRREFIAQAQARQPEGGKGAARHYQRLQNQQRIGAWQHEVEQ